MIKYTFVLLICTLSAFWVWSNSSKILVSSPEAVVSKPARLVEVKKVIQSPANSFSTSDQKPRSVLFNEILFSTFNEGEAKSLEQSQNFFYQAMKQQSLDKEKYVTLLKKSLDFNPNNVEALGRYAGYLMSKSQFKEAIDLARTCLSEDIENSLCHRVMVSSFTRQGDFENGYPYILDCLDKDPSNTDCLGGMVTTLLSFDDFEAAKAVLDEVELTEHEDSLWLHLSRGQYYQRVGQTGKALSNYKAACDLGQPFACKMVGKIEERN